MQRLVGKREHAPDFLCVTYSKKSVTNLHFQENLVSENCNCKYCVCILIQVLESLGEGYTVISLNIVSLIYQFLLFCVFFFFLGLQMVHRGNERNHSGLTSQSCGGCFKTGF